MGRQKALEAFSSKTHIASRQEGSIKELFLQIDSMDLGGRTLPMEIVMKECTKMMLRTEKERTYGQMDQFIKDNFIKACVWVWVC